jgi:hypothetical protein
MGRGLFTSSNSNDHISCFHHHQQHIFSRCFDHNSSSTLTMPSTASTKANQTTVKIEGVPSKQQSSQPPLTPVESPFPEQNQFASSSRSGQQVQEPFRPQLLQGFSSSSSSSAQQAQQSFRPQLQSSTSTELLQPGLTSTPATTQLLQPGLTSTPPTTGQMPHQPASRSNQQPPSIQEQLRLQRQYFQHLLASNQMQTFSSQLQPTAQQFPATPAKPSTVQLQSQEFPTTAAGPSPGEQHQQQQQVVNQQLLHEAEVNARRLARESSEADAKLERLRHAFSPRTAPSKRGRRKTKKSKKSKKRRSSTKKKAKTSSNKKSKQMSKEEQQRIVDSMTVKQLRVLDKKKSKEQKIAW